MKNVSIDIKNPWGQLTYRSEDSPKAWKSCVNRKHEVISYLDEKII